MEFLVSCGAAADLTRCQLAEPMDCLRGDRVVVRGQRGLELGVVRCPVTPLHSNTLESNPTGEILRKATPEDEQIAEGVRQRSLQLFEDGRRLAAELNLPIEIIDVEVLLDGHQVTLYFVRWGDGDERPLVSALSKKYESMVALRDLALPAGTSGCGQPDCGSKDGGGCSTCGTDGGCSTGGCLTGCGSKAKAGEVRDYFISLRGKMEQAQRTSLL